MPVAARNAAGDKIEGASQPSTAAPSSGGPQPKAAGPSLPSLTPPKGGGAIRGLGERFSVNSATGAGGLSIKLPVSSARGVDPSLSLGYSTSGGAGLFGLGWSIGSRSISRKTDRGVPRYCEAPGEEDTYVLTGSDDLVPALKDDGTPDAFDRTFLGVTYEVRRFRPRIEGSFTRIERWRRRTDGDVHWRTIDRDNTTTVFGDTVESRVQDPEDARRVYSWLVARSWTDRGERIDYRYLPEDLRGVADTAFEAQRVQGAARHPKRILYGYDRPFDPEAPAAPATARLELVLDYGDHDPDAPASEPDRDWVQRPDPFSSYRSGFEIRTHRLCRRLLMFHRFPELGPEPVLVRSVSLAYVADDPARADEGRMTSLLASVTLAGHIPGLQDRKLPPLTFDYSPATLHEDVQTLDRASHVNLPGGLGPTDRLIDLDGEGVAGVLSEEGESWYYKRGEPRFDPEGDEAPQAGFGWVERVERLPGGTRLDGERRLIDVSGEGRLALAVLEGPLSGLMERDVQAGGWRAFRPFFRLPKGERIAALRMLDIDGDGRTDLARIDEDMVRWWPSEGRTGFGAERRVPQQSDPETRVRMPQPERREAFLTADMSGDGLTDFVRIANGCVTYWPALGHGRFGKPVRMRDAPRFDDDDRFDPARIRLGDVDGTGPGDIVYLHPDGPRIYRNRSGNGFAPAEMLPVGPRPDEVASASMVDLMGTGTSCLVWSSPRPSETGRAFKYIDLMAGGKPHLMIASRNNLGGETRIRYRPSTAYYLEDRAAGRPWLTRLHFPVQLVSEMETFDHVTRRKLATRYRYHHGYYDGFEREFRGFACVEQIDTQTLSRFSGKGLFTEMPLVAGDEFHLPPVRTRTWYHTGALIGRDDIASRLAQEYWSGDPQAARLPDTVMPPDLGPEERQEAVRALKGSVLRVEVFADDGTAAAAHPYSVTETSSRVRRVQPRAGRRTGVFLVEPAQELGYNYERNPADPRLTHRLTLRTDRFGHPIRVAKLAYPRRPASDRIPEQAAIVATVEETDLAHRDDAVDWYRIGVAVESRAFEIHGLAMPPSGLFERAVLDAAFDGMAPVAYEADTAAASGKRLLSQQRTYYRSDDLATRLPLGEIGRMAIVHESFCRALTPGLLTDNFGSRVTAAILSEGGYVSEGGELGWVPSGRSFFAPVDGGAAAELIEARANFFLVRRVVDAFGNSARIDYDPYRMLPVETVDSIGNRIRTRMHYRVLASDLVTDANGARQAVRFDALGMVSGSFRMGPIGSGEGDPFDDTVQEAAAGDLPGLIMDYDLHAWARGDGPAFIRIRSRTRHGDPAAPMQETWTYSDGSGGEALRKVQAEPGLAPLRDADGTLRRAGDGSVMIGHVDDRWVGTGRVIPDNKGNPVKEYEPFFDSGPGFVTEADLVETGATAIKRYDPQGRLVRTDHPDGRFHRVEFGPWSVTTWDENDTAGASQWFAARGAPTGAAAPADPEERAAWLAARSAGTPAVNRLDVLGQTVRSIADLGPAVPGGVHRLLETRSVRDSEGRLRAVVDPAGRTVALYSYDMLGRRLRHRSIDGDDSLELSDLAGGSLRSWTRRGFAVRHEYDALRRHVRLWITDPNGTETLAERLIYGEGHPDAAARGLRGRLFRRYDSSGLSEQTRFDFSGALIEGLVAQAADYRSDPDWTPIAAAAADPVALDAATAGMLEPERWRRLVRHDALDRVIQSVAPHVAGRTVSAVQPSYNRAGLVEKIHVWTGLPAAPAGLLDPAQATHAIVTGVEHDAHGRRARTEYGNGTESRREFDPLSFRLARATTTRSGFPAAERVVQSLTFTYDAVGNVVQLADSAQQPAYFSNAVVTADLLYEHDALDRLVRAEGREHLGLNGGGTALPPVQPGDSDASRHIPHKHDGSAVGRYVESYSYDDCGNLLEMAHIGASGSWVRRYAYDAASSIEPGRPANLLTATSRPGDPAAGPFGALLTYDEHGNLASAPHLSRLEWNHSDELRATARQATGPGLIPETTWYVMGAGDSRARKVTDRSHAAGAAPLRKRETLYFGDLEIVRDYAADGVTIVREVETFSVADGGSIVALVETRTIDADTPAGVGTPLLRFRHDNQIGSVTLELDGSGAVIGYEEYLPFGGTALLIESAAVRAAAKRYRYSGKERDEENGFYFYGARYYAPWLGRWISPDPEGVGDHINAYVFVQNNPVTHHDPNGRWTWREAAVVAAVVTVAVVVTVATAGAGAALVGAAAAAGASAAGATGAAVATGVATVAVGAATGALAAGAADVTAQGLTTGTVDLRQTGATMAGGLAAGGAMSVIPGASAARAVGASLRTGMGAVAATRAATSSAARAVVASRAAAATRTSVVSSGSAVRQGAVMAGRGAVSGASGGIIDEATRQSAAGEARDWNRIAASGAMSGVFGAVGGGASGAASAVRRSRAVERAAAAAQAARKSPAAAAVHEPASGRIFTGSNAPPSRPVHPLLAERITGFGDIPTRTHPNYFGMPGQHHAEVNAISDALYARQRSLGRELNADDLGDLLLHIERRGKVGAGTPMDRCPRCSVATSGVELTPSTRRAEEAWFNRYMRGDFNPNSPLP